MDRPHRNEPVTDRKQPQYDPPKVEEVLTSDDLEREVHYAGTQEQPSGGVSAG